jgi:polar amino acid transport system permease protein
MAASRMIQSPAGSAGDWVDPDDIVAIPLKHRWRWIAAALLTAVFAMFAISLWQNDNIQHDTITKYLFNYKILSGVKITVIMTVLAMVIATILGVLLAIMRLSANPVLRTFSWLYVWIFRGTPLLIQIVFFGYLGLLYGRLSLGIPFTGVVWASADTNALVSAFTAGLLALALNEAAYAAEIVRAGMLSVDSGQREAAYSLGMSPGFTLRKIILPQAMRVIIPPMGNETISMLKNTSLLSLIAVMEMYTVATLISAQNLRQVELLVVISIWYLILTTILSVPQYYLERRYGRGNARALPPTPLQRLRKFIGDHRDVAPTTTPEAAL